MREEPGSNQGHLREPNNYFRWASGNLPKGVGSFGSLLVFLVVVIGGGTTVGVLTLPGPWYADLIKPSFNPPNWVFGPVWTLLYISIAVAGWRSWKRDQAGTTMKIWYAQMFLNFTWSPLFFAAHRIDLALCVILLLLASIVIFIFSTWRLDRMSALLFVPYAAWVAFAVALNGSLLHLNLSTGG